MPQGRGEGTRQARQACRRGRGGTGYPGAGEPGCAHPSIRNMTDGPLEMVAAMGTGGAERGRGLHRFDFRAISYQLALHCTAFLG